MPRVTTLEPTKDRSKNLWYICIPAEFSSSGKWKREYFSNREKARSRSAELKRIRRDKDHYAAKASPSLIRDAVECNELAQIYGYSGFREAFIRWAETYEKRKSSISLKALVDLYEKDHIMNWSKRYIQTRWKSFCNLMAPIEAEIVPNLNTDFWREYLTKWRDEKSPAAATYNQNVSMLRAVFKHEKAFEHFSYNPIDSIPNMKAVKGDVCVSSPAQVKSLLDWVWENDRALVPYFALGFFAGLRPMAEIEPMKFEQLLFDTDEVNVITTKTRGNPRRQVPLEKNLRAWLEPFRGERGLVCPSNLRRRIDRARKAAGIIWGHDIMRHSYGSYWEAEHRKEAGCREQLSYNMGHNSFKTYEQNYRNDRSQSDAKAYWQISPPQ